MKKKRKKKNVKKISKTNATTQRRKRKGKKISKSKQSNNRNIRVRKSNKRNTKTKRKTRARKRVSHKRYSNFLVTFTVTRSYTYNRPSELEIFIRSIPVLYPVTLAGFRKKYLDWIVEEEKKVFEKITEDQDGAVSWSGWIIEVKPGEEE